MLFMFNVLNETAYDNLFQYFITLAWKTDFLVMQFTRRFRCRYFIRIGIDFLRIECICAHETVIGFIESKLHKFLLRKSGWKVLLDILKNKVTWIKLVQFPTAAIFRYFVTWSRRGFNYASKRKCHPCCTPPRIFFEIFWERLTYDLHNIF